MKISYEIVKTGEHSCEISKITNKMYYKLITPVVIIRDEEELVEIAVEFFTKLCEINQWELTIRG